MLGNRPDDRNEKHVQSIRLEKYGNRIFGTWKLGPRVFYASFLKISSIPNNRIVDTTNLSFFNLCASRVSRYSHYSKTSFYIYIYTYIWNRYIHKKEKKRRRNFSNSLSTSFHPRSRLLLESIRSSRLVSFSGSHHLDRAPSPEASKCGVAPRKWDPTEGSPQPPPIRNAPSSRSARAPTVHRRAPLSPLLYSPSGTEFPAVNTFTAGYKTVAINVSR